MRPTKHAPDSEPDKRGTGRWFAYGSLLPSLPEVGAVCGKAARTDLGGGREVTRVPTANPSFDHTRAAPAQVSSWHTAAFAAGTRFGRCWRYRGLNARNRAHGSGAE